VRLLPQRMPLSCRGARGGSTPGTRGGRGRARAASRGTSGCARRRRGWARARRTSCRCSGAPWRARALDVGRAALARRSSARVRGCGRARPLRRRMQAASSCAWWCRPGETLGSQASSVWRALQARAARMGPAAPSQRRARGAAQVARGRHVALGQLCRVADAARARRGRGAHRGRRAAAALPARAARRQRGASGAGRAPGQRARPGARVAWRGCGARPRRTRQVRLYQGWVARLRCAALRSAFCPAGGRACRTRAFDRCAQAALFGGAAACWRGRLGGSQRHPAHLGARVRADSVCAGAHSWRPR